MGNITSLPSSLQSSAIIQPKFARVEYLYVGPSSTGYTSGTWKEMPGAVVNNLTNRIGHDPSTCQITIPVDISKVGDQWRQGRAYTHRVMEARDNKKELAAFGPLLTEIKLWTKIRIFCLFPDINITAYGDIALLPRLFVGYITKFTYSMEGIDRTEIYIHAKCGMELLRKTPISGVLFMNPEDGTSGNGETVYIRDHPIIFNEGGLSDRWHRFADGEFGGDSALKPRFIRRDYNRFIDDPGLSLGQYYDGFYAADAALEHPTYHKFIGTPHARKWYAGHVWNYIRNLIDSNYMKGANVIYDNPSTTPDDGELPIMRDQEVYITPVTYTPDDKMMFHDLFEPRAYVGQTFQTGQGDATSGLGEFNVTGMPTNQGLHETLRRVGNYTIAKSYNNQDKLVVRPIRTTLAYTEIEDAKIGNRGGSGGSGGKRLTIVLPGDDVNIKPNAFRCEIVTDSENYYNRMRMGGGPRIIQATFLTVAKNPWTDSNGQTHQAYNYKNPLSGQAGKVPEPEWIPKGLLPTLIPGWSLQDQNDFTLNYTQFKESSDQLLSGASSKWPDVFRTWIIPQDGPYKIDWVSFFDKEADTPGFRRFFDRDREALAHLVTKFFNTTLGLFRRRAENLPIAYCRSTRGIRINSSGATSYGNSGDGKEGEPLHGQSDWYPIQSDAEIVTDGRLGFRLGMNAQLADYHFENWDGSRPSGAGTGPTPMSWNGLSLANGPRAYEMLWTVPIILDEDLWEQIDIPNPINGLYQDKLIEKYGPAMEYYVESSMEHRWEEAIHSLVPRLNPKTLTPMVQIPPVKTTGTGMGIDDTETRIYNDPTEEMRGRLRMLANRQMVIDQIADITVPYIEFSIQAGDYIRDIKLAKSESASSPIDTIRINAMCTSVTHDFQNQQTVLRLETIK